MLERGRERCRQRAGGSGGDGASGGGSRGSGGRGPAVAVGTQEMAREVPKLCYGGHHLYDRATRPHG